MGCNVLIFEHILTAVQTHAVNTGWKLAGGGFGSKLAGTVAAKYGSQVQADYDGQPLTWAAREAIIKAATHDAIQAWEAGMHPFVNVGWKGTVTV